MKAWSRPKANNIALRWSRARDVLVAQITFAVVRCIDELMLLSADYKNEPEVGEALAEAFSTGLLWNSDHGHVVEACKDSLKKLRLYYLDLYLIIEFICLFIYIHAGVGTTGSALDEDGVLEIDTTISLETTWHAMEALVSMGLFQRESLVKFCQKHGICVTAHTPLGGAVANSEWFVSVSCLDDPVLKNLAEKYKKTAAQVVLRWGIQRNTVNFQVFDFELTKEDMDLIARVDRKHRTNQPAKFWGVDLFA
ncbi:NADP-dependent D-sorbitol-6-phosphate dehydrogenase-like [Pyrus ussuriensis x Pyrus communis]|uniref:NADP-dependent D-sorbitol-6-phosphate dehydrogenase-like n=1 Tax=Pyrus ussuriensis x Pyrus communis TaxID=2448454 RepID=A0A5N5HV42_9ROSA|nr:NADP-dependent D-sorbitol-6-phosphate dehydrogenase-like [Pyrus ussuriensis x Pyrus communis]